MTLQQKYKYLVNWDFSQVNTNKQNTYLSTPHIPSSYLSVAPLRQITKFKCMKNFLVCKTETDGRWWPSLAKTGGRSNSQIWLDWVSLPLSARVSARLSSPLHGMCPVETPSVYISTFSSCPEPCADVCLSRDGRIPARLSPFSLDSIFVFHLNYVVSFILWIFTIRWRSCFPFYWENRGN